MIKACQRLFDGKGGVSIGVLIGHADGQTVIVRLENVCVLTKIDDHSTVTVLMRGDKTTVEPDLGVVVDGVEGQRILLSRCGPGEIKAAAVPAHAVIGCVLSSELGLPDARDGDLLQ